MAWPAVVMAISAALTALDAINTESPESKGETSSTPGDGGIGQSTVGSRGQDPLDLGGAGSLLASTPVGPSEPIEQQGPPRDLLTGDLGELPATDTSPPPGGEFGWLETLQAMGPAIGAIAPLLKGDPKTFHRQSSSSAPISPGGSARSAGLQGARDRLSAGDILSRIRGIS